MRGGGVEVARVAVGVEQGGACPRGRAAGSCSSHQRLLPDGEGGAHVAGVPRSEGGGAEDLGGEPPLTGQSVGQRRRPGLTFRAGLEQAELEQGDHEPRRLAQGAVGDEKGLRGAILGELRTDRLNGAGLPRSAKFQLMLLGALDEGPGVGLGRGVLGERAETVQQNSRSGTSRRYRSMFGPSRWTTAEWTRRSRSRSVVAGDGATARARSRENGPLNTAKRVSRRASSSPSVANVRVSEACRRSGIPGSIARPSTLARAAARSRPSGSPSARLHIGGSREGARAGGARPRSRARHLEQGAGGAGQGAGDQACPPCRRAAGRWYQAASSWPRWRKCQATDLRSNARSTRRTIAAYFHTGGTTGAPKLAAAHPRQPGAHELVGGHVLRPHARRRRDQRLPAVPRRGSFVFGTSAFLAGATLILPTRLGMRSTEFVRNYWRFVEKYRVSLLVACRR